MVGENGYRTRPDSALGWYITKYDNLTVTVEAQILRNYATVTSIKEATK